MAIFRVKAYGAVDRRWVGFGAAGCCEASTIARDGAGALDLLAEDVILLMFPLPVLVVVCEID